MITFTTESGATYEVDDGYPQVMVRRLGGPATTARASAEWKNARSIKPPMPRINEQVLIHWKDNDDGSANCTLTSRVVSVESDAECDCAKCHT